MSDSTCAQQLQPHVPRLRRYALLLAGESASGDELVRDTLEHACGEWARWYSFAPPEPERAQALKAWLLASMHDIYIDQLRRNGRDGSDGENPGDAANGRVAARRRAASADADNEPSPSGGHRPVAAPAPVFAAGSTDFERALAALPPELREVMLLACVEDFSYQQTADIVGAPLGAVIARLHLARERLRSSAGVPPLPRNRRSPGGNGASRPGLKVVK